MLATQVSCILRYMQIVMQTIKHLCVIVYPCGWTILCIHGCATSIYQICYSLCLLVGIFPSVIILDVLPIKGVTLKIHIHVILVCSTLIRYSSIAMDRLLILGEYLCNSHRSTSCRGFFRAWIVVWCRLAILCCQHWCDFLCRHSHITRKKCDCK